MTADIQEVKLNLSLAALAPSQTSPDPALIGPVIPAHIKPSSTQHRGNPYLHSTSHISSPQDAPFPKSVSVKSSSLVLPSVSPPKQSVSSVKCSSLVSPSVSSPKQSVSSVNDNFLNNVAPSAAGAPCSPSNTPPVNSLKRNSTSARQQKRDVTKSRRYQYSLSFLLGSLNDNNDDNDNSKENSGLAEQRTVSSEKTLTQNANSVKTECSDGAGMEINEIDSCQKTETSPILESKCEDTSLTLPVTMPTTGNTNKPPPATPTTLRHSKRPCPHKFAEPNLSKTTSKLFSNTPNNYLKGCKWSPDGLALLTCSRDKTVRIFNAPDVSSPAEQHPTAQHSTANVPYDVAWNPNIDHLAAQNCNFVVSCKDSPVQLVDAFTGKTRASFTAFNSVEVLISAFSVCYLSSDKVLAGYCKHVRVFDATRPGRECSVLAVGDKQHENNNSIVSTVAQHPSSHGLFGAGCYNSTVALYSTEIEGVLMPFYGPQHGVTQITFSQDGTRLYCGSRMESEIYCFDTRYNGSVLHTYKRDVQTHQRIQFDINTSQTLLATGNHDGSVLLFDLTRGCSSTNQLQEGVQFEGAGTNENEEVSSRGLRFEAHKDTVNGVSFHPYWGLLATVSGRRHFHIEDSTVEENSLKIWSF
ncbi:hypothetical protein ACHWQZ_G015435 [Mnemiopsis leidyi]